VTKKFKWTPPTEPCLFVRCNGKRHLHEVGCVVHWKSLTDEERQTLHRSMMCMATAGIDGDQGRFDAAREHTYQLMAAATERLEKEKTNAPLL